MLFQIRITYFCLWVTKHLIINFLESYSTDCLGFSGNLALFCEVRRILETIFAETNTLVSLVTSTDNQGEISRKKVACIAVIVSQFHRSILINNSCLLKKRCSTKNGNPGFKTRGANAFKSWRPVCWPTTCWGEGSAGDRAEPASPSRSFKWNKAMLLC